MANSCHLVKGFLILSKTNMENIPIGETFVKREKDENKINLNISNKCIDHIQFRCFRAISIAENRFTLRWRCENWGCENWLSGKTKWLKPTSAIRHFNVSRSSEYFKLLPSGNNVRGTCGTSSFMPTTTNTCMLVYGSILDFLCVKCN